MIITMDNEKRFNILFTAFFMFFGFLVFFISSVFLPNVSYDNYETGKFVLRKHLNKYYTQTQTANSLYKHGDTGSEINFRRGYVGIQITQLPDAGREKAGSDVINGILVKEVFTGSPAHKSGITAGDIILSINGKTVKHTDEAIIALENSSAGKTIKVILQNKNEIVERNVTTELWPNFYPFRIQYGHLQTTRN